MERYTQIKRMCSAAMTHADRGEFDAAHRVIKRALSIGMTAHDFTTNTTGAFRAEMRKRARAGEFA